MMACKPTPERTELLVRRAQCGDKAAFDELAAACRPNLAALIRSRLGAQLGRELEVEDILQETMLKALQSIARFSFRGEGSFLRWLGTIAENVMRTAARRKSRRRGVPLGPEVPDRGEPQIKSLRRDERFDRFQRAFDALDHDSRQVIHLARIQGLPIKEVARRLDRTPNATSILLYRALIKLKGIFGDTESLRLPWRSLRGEEEGDAG
jgi:RNA polymerase sigma-70 factor, ECF subfamily